MPKSVFFISEVQPILCKDSANRVKYKLKACLYRNYFKETMAISELYCNFALSSVNNTQMISTISITITNLRKEKPKKQTLMIRHTDW